MNIRHAGVLPRVPSSLRLLWRGRLAGGARATHYFGGALRRVDLEDFAATTIDLAAGTAEIRVRAGHDDSVVLGCLAPALTALLGVHGRHILHAALLADRRGRGVLLCGPSGAGKSTTALALSRGPLRLLGDDTCCIQRTPGGRALRLWALGRPCKVTAQTKRLLPWLDELPQRRCSAGEWRVEPASLLARPMLVRPWAVLLVAGRSRRHSVEPISSLEALEALTCQNVRTAGDISAHSAGADAFAMLARLVTVARCYRLSTSAAVDELPKLAAELLEAPRAASPG
jgi:hypothetical protein